MNIKFIRWTVVGIGVLLLGLLIIFLVISLTRIGKTELRVEVLPEDSQVFANDQQISSGSTYLEPGTYTIRAISDGFAEATSTVELRDEQKVAVLILDPVSNEAKEWYMSDEVSLQRETLGGILALERGQQLVDNNPLIDRLPHVDFAGPFVVDYGFYGADSTDTYIDINNSTPDGRQAGLVWIREQGFDPVDLDLRFSDYVSPLSEDRPVGDF